MNAAVQETATRIDVCLCTFRRPHVADTLRSLARLTLRPDWALRVVVADNDDTPSAESLVASVARETGLVVHYVHAPARNISVARNACLDAIQAPYAAFVDDDELVTPSWLVNLMAALEKEQADIAVGPVYASYDEASPAWVKLGDFHSLYPVLVKGKIKNVASNNVLMRFGSPVFRNLRFRLDLGRSGGEDTLFFAAAHQAGAVIAYAPDAIVTEAVPESRMKLGWMFRRRFRYGQTHGTLLLSMHGSGGLRQGANVLLAFLKCCACFLMIPFCIGNRNRLIFWTLRSALHAGVISRLLGKPEVECYG